MLFMGKHCQVLQRKNECKDDGTKETGKYILLREEIFSADKIILYIFLINRSELIMWMHIIVLPPRGTWESWQLPPEI